MEDRERRIRLAGLDATLKIVPFSQSACLVSAVGLALVFWDRLEPWVWGSWLLLVTLAAAGWTLLAHKDGLKPPVHRRWPGLPHLALGAAVGGLFAVLLGGLFPILPPGLQLILGIFTFTFLASGAFAFPATPALAVVWILVVGSAADWVLLTGQDPLKGMLLGFHILFQGYLVLVVLRMSRWYRDRIEVQIQTEDQGDTIRLLLRDFEESAGDWLWETDTRGILRHVSPQLERVFRGPTGSAAEKSLDELIRRIQGDLAVHDPHSLAALSHRSGVPTPFRDLLVRVVVEGAPTWWELTGKPLFSADGTHTGWRGVGRDVTERVLRQEETEYHARFDSLTGLANRYHFRQELDRYLADPARADQEAVLVLIDLDHLQNINSILGHETGDAVLQEIGRRLGSFAWGRGGLAARLGGDDFALFLRVGPAAMDQTSGALLDSLKAPLPVQGEVLEIRSWIGYAFCTPGTTSSDKWFQGADSALSAAKETGPNSVRDYDGEMAERYLRRLSLTNALGKAQERNEFTLVYQPQVDALTGRVVGAEALCRWESPRLGSLSPVEFIPLAEQSGHIVDLGAWVLGQACRDAVWWPRPWKVSVNVSAGQLLCRGFEDEVFRILGESGLPASRLKLEITESALISDGQAVRESLEALRSRGVTISLDDFGTGYSSLSYLRSFPLDELKIDQSFVRSLEADPQSRAIVETIIRLAKILKLTITAEGVETEGQARMLGDIGCEVFQGFLFGRPVTPGEISDLAR